MTHNEIIRMAREAGLLSEDEAWVSPHQESMERFAALVAAAEREACAKLCDEFASVHQAAHLSQMETAADLCAIAIRSRRTALGARHETTKPSL